MFGRHHAVSAAVGLAGDHGDFRHGRLGVGVEDLGAVANGAAVFLRRSRQETGDIDEGHQRDVEAVAEADEARALDRRVDVEDPRQKRRLIGDDADGNAVVARETDQQVGRELLSLISKNSPLSTVSVITVFMS